VTVGKHLIKTVLVNEMVARRDLRGYPGRVNIFLAYWTITPGYLLHTFMFSLQMVR
jgi:hypothetical protein